MNASTASSTRSWIPPIERRAIQEGLLLVLLLTLPAAVQAQFDYTTNNGTITITRYTGSGGAADIPDTINGLPVTTIGDSAFYFCKSLTSLKIPDSVVGIGYHAFAECWSLAGVTIGNSVASIGDFAFAWCDRLGGIVIPNSVVSIGEGALLLQPEECQFPGRRAQPGWFIGILR